jgi:phosphatidylglycerophosphatase A
MKKHDFAVKLATLGPIGYLMAPGTAATVLTLPAAYVLQCAVPSWQTTIIMLATALASYFVYNAAQTFQEHDPSVIIIDECIGCLVTFWHIPWSMHSVIWGLVLFRLLDIFKPLGISSLEKIPGFFGIMADDIVAALIANILLRMIVVRIYVHCSRTAPVRLCAERHAL